MEEFTHLHPSFRSIARLPTAERIAAMDEPRWIGYQRANDILADLVERLGRTPRPRAGNLLIVGDSNNGKTTLIEHFGKLHGAASTNAQGDPVRPVIIAEAPSSADEKSLYVSILERFWTPYRATDVIPKLRYQLIHLMRACHVRMLIIDELHSMLTGSPVKQREVMNALKLLSNELRIPIVGVGLRDAVRILHTDPQHASRFDVAALPVWNLDTTFQRLLSSFELILPLRLPSRLSEAKLATKLHAISEGNLGNVHRLLVACAASAMKDGKERIDLETVSAHQWLRPTQGLRQRFG